MIAYQEQVRGRACDSSPAGSCSCPRSAAQGVGSLVAAVPGGGYWVWDSGRFPRQSRSEGEPVSEGETEALRGEVGGLGRGLCPRCSLQAGLLSDPVLERKQAAPCVTPAERGCPSGKAPGARNRKPSGPLPTVSRTCRFMADSDWRQIFIFMQMRLSRVFGASEFL